ncbi:MAG: hemerythrin domain-containing protein [Terriglobales bacterium]
MASAEPAVSKVSEDVQHEHQQLIERLQKLDRALDALVCYSEVYADLGSSAEIVQQGRWLAGWLPGHFVREEETMLAPLARLGPDFAAFAREMKLQHQEIGRGVEAFCRAASRLRRAEDLQQSICDLKDQGKRLTSTMAAHLGAEERKFAAIK